MRSQVTRRDTHSAQVPGLVSTHVRSSHVTRQRSESSSSLCALEVWTLRFTVRALLASPSARLGLRESPRPPSGAQVTSLLQVAAEKRSLARYKGRGDDAADKIILYRISTREISSPRVVHDSTTLSLASTSVFSLALSTSAEREDKRVRSDGAKATHGKGGGRSNRHPCVRS